MIKVWREKKLKKKNEFRDKTEQMFVCELNFKLKKKTLF